MDSEIETETFSTAAGYVGEEKEISPIRIWLVDDNAGFRGLLADLLDGEAGFECSRQFPSPPAILRALGSETPPDVIVLDIQMGAHNGLDAIRPIKSLAPETHVLMLTTFRDTEIRERAFREGASDFMLKSWSLNEIAAHIRQAMEFGSVAGLLTAFLAGERPVAKPVEPEPAEMPGKANRNDRWFDNLRSLLKLSPSKTF